MDDDLSALARTWQAWEGAAPHWLQRAQRAHRQEAALHAAYWAALLFGALAMAVATYVHGVVSWPRTLFGGATLLFGAGAMLRARSNVARERQLLTARPASAIADLIRLRERELVGWTARWAKLTTGALGAVAVAMALENLHESVQLHQSVKLPGAILLVCLAALGLVARIGMTRVRSLRSELTELRRLERELSD